MSRDIIQPNRRIIEKPIQKEKEVPGSTDPKRRRKIDRGTERKLQKESKILKKKKRLKNHDLIHIITQTSKLFDPQYHLP